MRSSSASTTSTGDRSRSANARDRSATPDQTGSMALMGMPPGMCAIIPGPTPMRASAVPRCLALALIAALALAGGCTTAPVAEAPPPKLDVVWVPSAPEVIQAMLETAKVGPGDVVYDLGCGNGEIVIAAAKLYGARAVGVDLDPARIREARLNAARAAVTDRVTFVEQDLFATDVRPATVVTLYLLPDLNARLRPKLLRELRPGARIVSHDFGIADWPPERTIEVLLARTPRVFLWRVPGG